MYMYMYMYVIPVDNLHVQATLYELRRVSFLGLDCAWCNLNGRDEM